MMITFLWSYAQIASFLCALNSLVHGWLVVGGGWGVGLRWSGCLFGWLVVVPWGVPRWWWCPCWPGARRLGLPRRPSSGPWSGGWFFLSCVLGWLVALGSCSVVVASSLGWLVVVLTREPVALLTVGVSLWGFWRGVLP